MQPRRAGLPAQRRVFPSFPQGGVFHARFALLATHPHPALWARRLRACPCESSSPASPAMSARPSSPASLGRPPRARLRALGGARRPPAGRRHRRGRRRDRRRPRPRARRRRRRLLPDPLDGGRRRRRVRRRRSAAPPSTSPPPRRAAGVRRIVYLGGLVPADGRLSRHLASRLVVEELLLAAAPESIALRASIVIGARSRSFRFLVRLIERLPVLALPAWRDNRTPAGRRARHARVPRPRRDGAEGALAAARGTSRGPT